MFEEREREWLDLICPRVKDEARDDEEEEIEEGAEEEEKGKEAAVNIEADILADNQCQFLMMLLGRIYSGDAYGSSKLGLRARAFIDRLKMQKDKGCLPDSMVITIDEDISAIENFFHLNRASKN
ncbi:hypothetical protein BG011_002540 [Mortierella polycephala]|uniref:Uncharacterized protein n=1 Tax=Mortierella polycephala TaxID=41804 RepID=A0A9P6PEM4_9FUNG|nr:hypothetical protein BG011_002540 [Mortierella polycephala]